MIKGIGVDIIEVSRIGKVIEKWGSHFLTKVFTESEIEYCNAKKNPSMHFAARFAAKEAFSKALTIGWSSGFRWKDVEVKNDQSGKPILVIYGNVKARLGNSNVLLSLSHTDDLVSAIVIIEN